MFMTDFFFLLAILFYFTSGNTPSASVLKDSLFLFPSP